MSEKDLPPTQKRLNDAKRDGQAPISKDVLSVVIVTVLMEIIFSLEPVWRTNILDLLDKSLYVVRFDRDNAFGFIFEGSFSFLMGAIVAVYSVAIFLSFLATWSHVGFIFSTKSYSKAFDKMNPATNLMGLVSFAKIVELLLCITKFVIITYWTHKTILKHIPDIILLPYGSLLFAWETFFAILKEMLRNILLSLGVFMFFDMKLKTMHHIKGLKMSHDEVKREYKESQGDPRMKGRRRQLAFEMLFSPMPPRPANKANAVVTNPSHFAVALYYDPKDCPVPVVIDKGVDADATDIINIAHEHDIPIVEFVWLARTLFSVGKIDQAVPRFAYKAVAFVYHFIKHVLDPELKDEPTERASLDDLYAKFENK